MLNTKPIRNYEQTDRNTDKNINGEFDTDNGTNNIDSKQHSINNIPFINQEQLEQKVSKIYQTENQKHLNQTNPINNVANITNVNDVAQIQQMNQFTNTNANPNMVNYQEKKTHVKFDEEKNEYVVYYDNNIECSMTNQDILRSIITPNNNEPCVRKYVFVISFNNEMNIDEFNFVNSSFTNNAQIMIQLQNFIYDTINHLMSLNQEETLDIVIIFYYQMIIFMFKNLNNYNNYENISKFYSTIIYRFSSLILKQTIKAQNESSKIKNNCEKILNIKQKLSYKIDALDKYIKQTNNSNSNMIGGNFDDSIDTDDNSDNSDNSDNNDDNSDNSDNYDDNSDNSDNSDNTDNTDNSDNYDDNSDNNTDESEYYYSDNESEDNYIENKLNNNEITGGYSEIKNTTVTYNDVFNSEGGSNILTSTTGTTVMSSQQMDPSYNINSAKNNGKVFKIKLN